MLLSVNVLGGVLLVLGWFTAVFVSSLYSDMLTSVFLYGIPFGLCVAMAVSEHRYTKRHPRSGETDYN